MFELCRFELRNRIARKCFSTTGLRMLYGIGYCIYKADLFLNLHLNVVVQSGILSRRLERHADGMFNKAYRKALGQLSARKYLHTLMEKRVG